MKKILFLSLMWGAVVAMLTLNACTNEAAEVSPDANPEGDIKNVTFIAGGFDEGIQAQSRVDYTLKDGGGASFAWATGDTIGILPNEGSQVYFKINQIDENEPNKALFTGVAWGLKAGVDYAAYYPFIQDIMLDRTKVPVDYSVQSYNYQVDGEGQLVVSPSHSYQAAKPVERADGGLNFEFKHLGALVEVQFTLPAEAFTEDESVAIKQLTLMANEAILPVKGTFNLNDETVVISPAEDEKAYFMTVNVTDLNATAGQPVSVFFMMPPMDEVDVDILNATVVYGEDDTLYPLSITSLKNSQDEEVTNLVAAKCYTLNTEAIDIPTAIEITDNSTLSSNVNDALGSLGGTKLRFVTRSPMVSETVVYTDDYEVNAYATRNGDWLEVHTLAKSFKLEMDAEKMFYTDEYKDFYKITSFDLRGFDTSEVTNMRYMFNGCSSLVSLDLSTFNTSKVTDMHKMFRECSSLTELDLSTFDTSNVEDMSYMFNECSSLTELDLSGFDTSNVVDMSCMFQECSSLTELDLSTFDTSNVVDMSCMFQYCSALTSIEFGENFNTSQVTDMNSMFFDCSSLTSIEFSENFNTSQVTNMRDMFYNCSALTSLDLSGFNTSNVEDMSYMFDNCSDLTALTFGEDFDTSSVTDMRYMFCGCESLAELDLSGFDTSSVTDMYDMFWYCCNLTILDLSNFTFSTEEEYNYEEMFGNVGWEKENVVIYVNSDEVITVLESLGSDYLWLPDYAQFQVKQSQPEN